MTGSTLIRRRSALPAFVFTLGLCAAPRPVRAAPAEDDIALLERRPTGMDEEVWRTKRREAARRLAKSRSPKAVDALIRIVETERFDAVLTIAMESLAKIGDPRAIDALQRVYADRSVDAFVRRAAADAIAALGGTPRDDARLLGVEGAGAAAGAPGAAGVGGPQLGAMGAASVAPDAAEDVSDVKPLPTNVLARDRDLAFVLGSLDLDANVPLRRPPGGARTGNPVLADAGLGVVARYVDERQRWGFRTDGTLWARVRNGDITAVPASDGSDDGDTLFIGQSLEGVGSVHVYFGRTDAHAFASVGISQRVQSVRVEDVQATGIDESALSDTRFGLDVVPAAGLGWGRHLAAGADLRIDALVAVLESENILTGEIPPAVRRALQVAVYRRANRFSTFPRLAAVLGVLRSNGLLAREPGPRLVHRIRSVLEDPSYLDRNLGIRVRAGFLFDAAIAQSDRFLREGDHNGAPFLQFLAGVPLDLEQQIDADLRFYYDVLGPLKGFSTDAGVSYTRFLHTKYSDYAGQVSVGARGGVSRRDLDLDQDGAPDDTGIGYRALAHVGYTYAFARGSHIALSADVGVDSGRLVVGLSLGLRFGIVRSGVFSGGRSVAAVGRFDAEPGDGPRAPKKGSKRRTSTTTGKKKGR